MYNKGQLVYIYYNDISTSLLAKKELQYSRFGYIIDKSNYTKNNEVHSIYKVKTVSGVIFTIDQTKELKLCSYDELKYTVGTIKEFISEQQYNSMLHMLELNRK